MKQGAASALKGQATYRTLGPYWGSSVSNIYAKLLPIACSKPDCAGRGPPRVHRIVPSPLMGPERFWNLTVLCRPCLESLPLHPPSPPYLQRLLVWKHRAEYRMLECMLNEIIFKRLPDILTANRIERFRPANHERLVVALSDAFNRTGSLLVAVGEFEHRLLTVYGAMYASMAAMASLGGDQAPQMTWSDRPPLCETCEAPIVLRPKSSRFCSEDCALENRKRLMVEMRFESQLLSYHDRVVVQRVAGDACLECTNQFPRRRRDQKFCSPKCRKDYHNRERQNKIGASRMRSR